MMRTRRKVKMTELVHPTGTLKNNELMENLSRFNLRILPNFNSVLRSMIPASPSCSSAARSIL